MTSDCWRPGPEPLKRGPLPRVSCWIHPDAAIRRESRPNDIVLHVCPECCHRIVVQFRDGLLYSGRDAIVDWGDS